MRALSVWLLACATACGGGDDAGSPDGAIALMDGGPDAPDAFSRLTIAEPTPPAVPVLTPCPEGWTERLPWRAGAPATCEPWPSVRVGECGAAFDRFPGAAGCTRIGSTCPADGWPADLAATGVIYVQPGATGGDGTRALPLATIDEALAVATAGAIIALSTGEHEARIDFRDAIEIRGACPAMTTLRTPPDGGTTILVNATGARVADLRITGPGEGIRAMTGSLALEGVLIDEAVFVGLVVQETAEVVADGFVLRRMRAHPTFGQGVGMAVLGGQVTLSRAVIEEAEFFSVLVDEPTSELSLDDVAVRNTQPGVSGEAGVALAVGGGARVSLSRSVVEHHPTTGISVSGVGSILELDHVLVRNIEAERATGNHGVGVAVYDGASATIRRTVCEHLRTAGMTFFTEADPTAVLLEDTVVRDVEVELATGERGYGIGVLRTTSLEAHRVLVEQAHTGGLSLYLDATGIVTDLEVRDIRPGGGIAGHGITVEAGASLDLERARVEETHEAGISVFAEGATVGAEDLVVRRLRSRLGDGTFGRGINVQDGAVTLVRARIEDALEVGLFAYGAGSTIAGTDVSIARTHERACAATGCFDGESVTLGNGLVSIGGANVTLSRFEVVDSAFVGVQIGVDATMDLDTGLVADNAIGLNLQNPAIEIARLSEGVVYRDNDTNLDATALPIPAPN